MRQKARVTLAAYIVCYFKTSLVWKVSKTNTETYHAQVSSYFNAKQTLFMV